MLFTRNEMNFLCQIHQVKTLVGFQTFSMLSKEESEEVVSSLASKGVLEEGQLSEQGLNILRGILLYMEARDFIKMDYAMFARYDKQDYVMIVKNKEDFEVEITTQDEIVATIMGKLKHWDQVEDEAYQKKLIKKEEFQKFMEDNPMIEALSYQRIRLDEEKEQSAIFFLHEGYLKHYDVKTGHLDNYPKRQVQKGIEAIFE